MSYGYFPFLYLPSVGSTNALLKARVQAGEFIPGAVAAAEQTAGRGRAGNTWVSLEGNVHLSVACPVDSLDSLPRKGPQIAAAVVRWLRDRFGVEAQIKWPNDWLVKGRKLGGLLMELVRAPEGKLVVVAGLGINVLQAPQIPGRCLFVPTRLADWAEVSLSIEEISRELADVVLEAATASEDPLEVYNFHRNCSATLGSRVRVALPGGQEIFGKAVDFTPDFRLCVETEAGCMEVQAGDCWHEPEAGECHYS